MTRSHIFRTSLLFAGVCMAPCFGANQKDCGKITARLCTLLTESQSHTQKFAVVIGIKGISQPEDNPDCVGMDPNTDTAGKCGNDAAYSAALKDTLKENARKLFSTYELWDGNNPAQRIQPPSESVPEPEWFFRNVLATEATLISVSNESYIHIIDRYLEDGPAKINPAALNGSRPAKARNAGSPINGFLINGRRAEEVQDYIPNWTRPLPR